MKERPILFSAPMVRAILDDRKTQTRRIIKGSTEHKGPYNPAYLEIHKSSDGWKQICPYGKPGDKLWVRETFGYVDKEVKYRADTHNDMLPPDWKPSIHMPRNASRINLLIKNIRIERLQNISEKDCFSEGIEKPSQFDEYRAQLHNYKFIAKAAFESLWKSVNGKESWDLNPWVWVIYFEREAERPPIPETA